MGNAGCCSTKQYDQTKNINSTNSFYTLISNNDIDVYSSEQDIFNKYNELITHF